MQHFKKCYIALFISALFLSACNDDDENPTNPEQGSRNRIIINTEELAINNAICQSGGVKYIAGYDNNGDGKLEPSEYISEKSVCNDGSHSSNNDNEIFKKALVNITLIAKEDNECPYGGQLVSAGVDLNSNGILEESETTKSDVLCADSSASFVPNAIINSLNANPSTVLPKGKTDLTATFTTPKAIGATKVFWRDSNGKVLKEENAEGQSKLSITAGTVVGDEVYTFSLETKDSQGNTVIQSRKIAITVSQAPSQTQKVALETQNVYLPAGFTTAQLTGDVHGAVLYATEPQQTRSSLPTPEGANLVGFVAERDAKKLNLGNSTESILNNSLQTFSSNIAFSGSISQFSKVVLPNGDISASYSIKLNVGRKLTDLLNELVKSAAVATVGGNVSSLLLPSMTEKLSLEFRLDIAVTYDDTTGRALITSTLVANEHLSIYQDLILNTTSEVIHADPSAQLSLKTDTFSAEDQTKSQADFLFVIDNSGSMSDNQDEISKLAEDFIKVLKNSSLNAKVGTITTDSDKLRGKGFTSDPNQITLDFKPGSSGSPIEQGIYFAEKALSPNGTVAAAGYPRSDASMSVVIMSDERSQYPAGAFDPKNNLFVDNKYRVYSIVNPSDAAMSQYDDLATSTLGQTLNILSKDQYRTFLETIAKNTGAVSAGYKLSMADTDLILSSSISVKVNGFDVVRSSTNGWEYYPLSRSVVFAGSAIPESKANITVAYQYVSN